MGKCLLSHVTGIAITPMPPQNSVKSDGHCGNANGYGEYFRFIDKKTKAGEHPTANKQGRERCGAAQQAKARNKGGEFGFRIGHFAVPT